MLSLHNMPMLPSPSLLTLRMPPSPYLPSSQLIPALPKTYPRQLVRIDVEALTAPDVSHACYMRGEACVSYIGLDCT